MHFCKVCNNMYYLKLGENMDTLVYYCRNCGHEDTQLSSENVCVSDTLIQQKQKQNSGFINEYTKEDPTLPRTTTIRCPDQDCESNAVKDLSKREVLYIRYDDTNMKYIYMCTTCNTTWKTNETL